MKDFNFFLDGFLFDDLTNSSCKLFDLRKAIDNSQGVEDRFFCFEEE